MEFLQRKEVEALSDYIISKAIKGGAWGADVFYGESVSHSISYKDGECDECSTGASVAIGLRSILADGRQGIASTCRFDKDSADNIVEWSLNNAAIAEPEEGITLYDGPLVHNEMLEKWDERICDITAKQRREYCLEMSDLARKADNRIVSVRAAGWGDGKHSTFFATSKGLSAWQTVASANCGVSVIAEENEEVEIGGYGASSYLLNELDIKKCAVKAVRDTVVNLGGRPINTGTYTAMIERETAGVLVEIIGDLFCASDVHKGRSMMAGKLGCEVASQCVNITDDATIPWKPGSCAWDDEGVPTGRTELIKNGTANAYLYNLQYAIKDNVKSTGNCARSIISRPGITTSNLIFAPGTESCESLMSNISDGIYITELMGLHTIDPISGDFSIGAKGLRIEHGELTTPVSTVTIASNLLELMKNIKAAGNDPLFSGSVSAPTLVVENVVIAGN